MEEDMTERWNAHSSEDLTPNDGKIHIYAWIIAGLCSAWATLLTLYLVYKHFRNYTVPKLQRNIVRILFMAPIYAVDSFFSLIFKQYALIFDVLRDCYEAYVLWLFFNLLINYFDGTDHLVSILDKKPSMKHPFPTCFFPKYKPGRRFLAWCRFCVLQFTLIKPLITITALVLYRAFDNDYYGEGNFTNVKQGYLYLTVIENISISVAMYYLYLFYVTTKEELQPFKPVPKFLCVKAIIFFSFWQGIVIAVLSMTSLIRNNGTWSKEEVATGTQDFIICLEMFAVSIVNIFVFGYKQFRNPNKTPFLRTVLSGRKQAKAATLPLLRNMKDAVHPRWDYHDARRALNEAPIFSLQVTLPFEHKLSRAEVGLPEVDLSLGEITVPEEAVRSLRSNEQVTEAPEKPKEAADLPEDDIYDEEARKVSTANFAELGSKV
eukprot:TRINITY_DN9001_c0_g1_i1.p1 TRINITY_DN9001_c0_g1~~TRINITY_DN9001_c0_g1_i1.p1  ORF type:complete len:434 (+),score=76.53 TRINITY_DN9001_c0_g1_i1:107-1408(+)